MYSLSMARKCEAIYEILTPTITVCGFVLKPAAVHCCQTFWSILGANLKDSTLAPEVRSQNT